MSNSSAFVIPAGLVLQQEGEAVSIVHEGDIILHGTLGLPIRRLRSTGGNIELHVDADLIEIEAAGRVLVGGALIVETLTGSRLEVQGGVQAQTLSIGDGGAQIDGDVQVEILSTSGDVTVHGNLKAQHVSTRGASLRLEGDTTAETITVSGGDLVVQGSLQVDDASASDGKLSVSGDLTARRISAQSVALSGSSIQVSVVQGAQRITVGESRIRADILIAPHVQLSASTSGKITVVEARNSPTPSAVKGCLSLSDLEEFGLDSESFLRERNLSALPEGGPPPQPPAETSAVEIVDDDADIEAEAEAEVEAATSSESEAEAAAAEYLSALSHTDFLEDEPDTALAPEDDGDASATSVSLDIDLDAMLSDLAAAEEHTLDDMSSMEVSFEEEDEPAPASVMINDDDLDELDELEMADGQDLYTGDGVEQLFDLSMEEQEDTSEEDPIYVEMLETVRRIEGCYDGAELPPAVTQLGEMVEARNYEGIRDDITNIWNQLLKFHQKRGLRIQPQVTTTFNTINTIVRRI